MIFKIGDCIYKKKFQGNTLVTDTTATFIISHLETTYTRRTHEKCVIAELDDGSVFEIMDSHFIYAEQKSDSIWKTLGCF